MNILKTFLTSDLSKKLNGYEFANPRLEQRNLGEEGKSEPKPVMNTILGELFAGGICLDL